MLKQIDADLKVKSGLLPDVAVKESQADAAAREDLARIMTLESRAAVCAPTCVTATPGS